MRRQTHRVAPNLGSGRASLLSAAREMSQQPQSARASIENIGKPAAAASIASVLRQGRKSSVVAALLNAAPRPTPAWAIKHAAIASKATGASSSPTATSHAWRAALDTSNGTLALIDERQQRCASMREEMNRALGETDKKLVTIYKEVHDHIVCAAPHAAPPHSLCTVSCALMMLSSSTPPCVPGPV